ncbi:MAG: hypothetical protein K0R12_311 [Gammaproteobacteria bacterium]|jgi:hypothetical protein|nr:hypothetical protein [Gammaproteobacteria bacterium]
MLQQINLLNAFAPPPKPLLPPVKMLQIIGLLIIVLMGIYISAYAAKYKIDKEYRALSATQQLQAAKLADLSSQLPDSEAAKEIQNDVNKLTEAISNKVELLKIIDRPNKNFADYMQALAENILSGVWLKEIIIDQENQEVALLGRTLNANLVPVFLSEIAREKAFSEVNFKQIKLAKPLDNNFKMAFALRTTPDLENAYIFPEDSAAESKKEEAGKTSSAPSLSEKLGAFIKQQTEGSSRTEQGGLTGIIQKALGQ